MNRSPPRGHIPQGDRGSVIVTASYSRSRRRGLAPYTWKTFYCSQDRTKIPQIRGVIMAAKKK